MHGYRSIELSSFFDNYENAKQYFENALGMIGDDKKRPTLLVEGPEDEDALRSVFSCRILPIPDPSEFGSKKEYAKGILIEFAKWLKFEKNYLFFLGIVDSDADRIEGLISNQTRRNELGQKEQEIQDANVFSTDWHDLDVHVFWECAREVIGQQFDRNQIQFLVNDVEGSTKEAIEKLWNLMLKPVSKMGILRLVLHLRYVNQEYLGKDLYENPFLTKTLEMHLKDAILQAPTDRKTRKELVALYKEIHKKLLEMTSVPTEDWIRYLVNGHDLIRVLGLCFMACNGDTSRKYANDEIPFALRKAFKPIHFAKSNLYNDISHWADGKLNLFR